MSFASGFFNSVDHDRLYDATDISRLFDGLIRDGIFASIGDCMVVKQSNQMNVTVGTGRAWFNHTWSYNDALYPVTIPPSEILMDRIDAIVLEINSVEAVRANSIKLIKGTPSSTPTKPALTNTKEVHQYPLAYVTVGKEVTSIRQADIENCVGTSVCPFVTGILEVISIEQLIPQWKDILNRFVEENTANFNTWMNGEKQDYQAWLAAAKKEIADWEATSKSDYQEWYDSIKNGYDQWFATIKAAYDANWSTFQQWEKSSQAEFDKWFENMKNKLEGDIGAKLTLETEKLGNEKVSLIESTKKDLLGTVEAPLMIGNAMRNLLDSNLSGFNIKTIGKNLIQYPYFHGSSYTTNGITFTVDSKGVIHASGTADASADATFALFRTILVPCLTVGNKYTMTASVKNGKARVFLINVMSDVVTNIASVTANDNTESKTFTFTRVEGALDSMGVSILKGTTVTDCQIKVQLEEGETSTDIVPYQSSTTKITKDTEFPNFDLKAFDSVTHIISPGNVQSFHADAPNGKYLLESIKKSAESGGVSYGATKPTNPKPGDLWVNPNETNVLYVYTGKYWYVTNGLYIGENGSFPSSPYVGQLVYNPNSKMMHVYIPYGGSFGGPGWYPVGSDDPGGYHYGASAPSNTKLLWIDTSGVAKFYNGSAWVPLAATWG